MMRSPSEDSERTLRERFDLRAPGAVAATSGRPLCVGDYVRWVLDECSWCEGVVVRVEGDIVREMTVVRTHAWQGAEGQRRLGNNMRPNEGTIDGLFGHVEHAPKPASPVKVDPLAVEYDGVSLRKLLEQDERGRREIGPDRTWRYEALVWTPAQRAAVSAHWSAELRAKIAATPPKQDRLTISCDARDAFDLD